MNMSKNTQTHDLNETQHSDCQVVSSKTNAFQHSDGDIAKPHNITPSGAVRREMM